MPATDDTKTVTLEEELHELEANESALEQRTNSLALVNALALVFGILGFGIALLALVFALSNRDDNNGTGHMRTGSAGSAMAGGAMMGGTAAGNAAPAGVRTIHVKLGEMWVKPDYTSVKAGKVTFAATNTGQVEHELMVERMPGLYVLFCNVTGHYAAGQHIRFNVTS
jgi:uncharacterized cupredoxin-like copper-binding protein